MADILRMDYINSLPQPFMVRLYGGIEWPVHDIEVQTGLFRIDVCGMLVVKHISDANLFLDADGVEHDADSFYIYIATPPAEQPDRKGPIMELITCKCGCGRKRYVRTADIKRGWGLFYSKSCKAREQERRTGSVLPSPSLDENSVHPYSSEGLGQS